jgi:hypothetical protein
MDKFYMNKNIKDEDILALPIFRVTGKSFYSTSNFDEYQTRSFNSNSDSFSISNSLFDNSIPALRFHAYAPIYSNQSFRESVLILQLLCRRWLSQREVAKRRHAATIITKAARNYFSNLFFKRKLLERKYINLEKQHRIWLNRKNTLRSFDYFVEQSCFTFLSLHKIEIFLEFFRFSILFHFLK